MVFGFNHYQAYCRGIDDGTWRLFDDSRVHTFGDYTAVLRDILKKHFRPVGVFYERLEPKAHFNLPNVKPMDWLLLSKQANEGDSLSLHQATWICPACLTENQQEVCQKCYELMPELTGWACAMCSSRNLETDRLCATCSSQRTRKCTRCGGFYDGEKCASCADILNTCSQCHRQAEADGLCSVCKKNFTNLLDLDSSGRCFACKRQLQAGKCPYCDAAPTPIKHPPPCEDCGKVHTGDCFRLASTHTISATSRCLRCGLFTLSCRCREPPVSSASMCLICNKPSQACRHSTALQHSTSLQHSTALRHSTALLCLTCNQTTNSCLCMSFPRTDTSVRCSRCKALLDQEKFCEFCMKKSTPTSPSCSCLPRSFICVQCRQKLV